MSAGSKANPLLEVTLHSGVATLPGTGGGDISGWDLGDDFFPRFAVLIFTNNGIGELTLGDNTDPVTLLVDGVPVGVLFEGREAILDPAGSIVAFAPADAASMGTTWSISAAVSSPDPVDVTIAAQPITTLDVTSSEIADSVWDEAIAGHLTTGSAGLALFLSKGLAQCNYVLDNTTFDSAGMLTGGRIRIFPNAATAGAATNGGAGEGEVASFTISASAPTPGQLQIYKVVQA